MIRGSTWLIFILLNLIFVALIARAFLTKAVIAFRKDFAKQRCNPLVIPFAEDPGKDFTFCVQKIQGGYMKYLMQPLNYMFDQLGTLTKGFDLSILDIRKMFNYIRNQIMVIIQSVFSVFLSIIIEFQRMTMAIKDLFLKMNGLMVVGSGMMTGSIVTAKSVWNGPPGQMVRALEPLACFHPSTLVKLKNGEIKKMKDLDLGDVLKDESQVRCVMKLSNFSGETYYKFPKSGVNEKDIYVTGRHFVKSDNGKFIHVKDHPEAIKMPNKKIKWLSCLITDKHRISIGTKEFWDWEDDGLYDANLIYESYRAAMFE